MLYHYPLITLQHQLKTPNQKQRSYISHIECGITVNLKDAKKAHRTWSQNYVATEFGRAGAPGVSKQPKDNVTKAATEWRRMKSYQNIMFLHNFLKGIGKALHFYIVHLCPDVAWTFREPNPYM